DEPVASTFHRFLQHARHERYDLRRSRVSQVELELETIVKPPRGVDNFEVEELLVRDDAFLAAAAAKTGRLETDRLDHARSRSIVVGDRISQAKRPVEQDGKS